MNASHRIGIKAKHTDRLASQGDLLLELLYTSTRTEGVLCPRSLSEMGDNTYSKKYLRAKPTPKERLKI